jgi:hypothetical protein
MPYYAKGDKVTFTGSLGAELFGIVGVVLNRRIRDRHYVYDVRINVHPPINIPGLDIGAQGIIRNIPSDWIEIFRG